MGWWKDKKNDKSEWATQIYIYNARCYRHPFDHKYMLPICKINKHRRCIEELLINEYQDKTQICTEHNIFAFVNN